MLEHALRGQFSIARHEHLKRYKNKVWGKVNWCWESSIYSNSRLVAFKAAPFTDMSSVMVSAVFAATSDCTQVTEQLCYLCVCIKCASMR